MVQVLAVTLDHLRCNACDVYMNLETRFLVSDVFSGNKADTNLSECERMFLNVATICWCETQKEVDLKSAERMVYGGGGVPEVSTWATEARARRGKKAEISRVRNGLGAAQWLQVRE